MAFQIKKWTFQSWTKFLSWTILILLWTKNILSGQMDEALDSATLLNNNFILIHTGQKSPTFNLRSEICRQRFEINVADLCLVHLPGQNIFCPGQNKNCPRQKFCPRLKSPFFAFKNPFKWKLLIRRALKICF